MSTLQTPARSHRVDLEISGMTCASCSSRIERNLNRMGDVEAVVNLATEKATVRYDSPVTLERIIETVRATGYDAEPVDSWPQGSPGPGAEAEPEPEPEAQTESRPQDTAEARDLRAPGADADAADDDEGGSDAEPAGTATLDSDRTDDDSSDDDSSDETRAELAQGEASEDAPAPADFSPRSPAFDPSPDSAGTGAERPLIPRTAAPAPIPPMPEVSRSRSPRVSAGERRRADLQRRAVVAVALTVPLAIIAMAPGIEFTGKPWVELLLATPVALWAAWPFHRAAFRAAQHGGSTMDTLVSIGVLTAYLWSAGVVLTGNSGPGGTHIWFESAAVITTFLLIGRWLESRATDMTRDSLRGLISLTPTHARILVPGEQDPERAERRVPASQVRVGDWIVVRPGERIAADGVVIQGTSAIDASMITGESTPVQVEPEDDVIGATVNTTGRLVVKATRVGSETTLAEMTRLVEEAQTTKAPIQQLADRVSEVFVPIVLALAITTVFGWFIFGQDLARAVEIGVTVLVIACPCALGLATPTALLVGTGTGARHGILIKGARVLQDTRAVDTVVLDKTGTVTTGRMQLTSVVPAGRLPKDQALRAAAAVEMGSEHPVARAIVEAAQHRGLSLPAIETFEALPGSGATASIKGTQVTVGRRELFDEVPDEIAQQPDSGTTVWLGWEGRAWAMLTVADSPRLDAPRAIAALENRGLRTYLLTGDSEAAASQVAAEVGIPASRVRADVRPAEKHDAIEALQSRGRVVAMVGDGINDAAALARADLGIAMGSGTDIAADSADIVVMRSRLGGVLDAIDLGRATLRTIKVNLGWAFGYNIAAIPLAMAGLLNPMIAGGAMALSSIFVVTNSLRLRRWRPSRT